MGRYGWRPVVENGLKLDLYRLQRQGLLKVHRRGVTSGSLEWKNTSSREPVASIGYVVDYESQTMALTYTKTIDREKHLVNDTIWLIKQKTNFNGSRFLFKCPKCYTRVAKLYLPNGALYFGCRRCYNLTYQSSNESGKFNSLFRHLASEMGVSLEAVKNILKNKW
jgi:DNA-directed RNA polymerase subunit M/transcription elongation factor TFIIS